jgi:DNA excision repair protein ERCC-4
VIVVIDTREQLVPPFPEGVEFERRTLPEGDYSTPALFDVARIERKSVADFGSTITWGRERFDREVQRLQAFRWKCIVVEGSLSDVYRDCAGVHPHAVLGTIASMLARHDVPVLFALNPTGCGRLMAGLLRRWEERVIIESGCKIPRRPAPIKKTRPKAKRTSA